MSRKTKTDRYSSSYYDSHIRELRTVCASGMTEHTALICSACGATGRYDVGTVVLDPWSMNSSNEVEKSIGFTGYFRCRRCDAGGPWKLTPETMMQIIVLVGAALYGEEDVPLILGRSATFDKKPILYATEGEAHLMSLIEREPRRAFLWVRLGNLYDHAGVPDRAKEAYLRAIELDPTDIEAHAMLGQLLDRDDRLPEAVPHFHAVLINARNASNVKKHLRRSLVRAAIEALLAAHVESDGEIEFLPTMNPEKTKELDPQELAFVEIREFDLGTERGVEELVDTFVGKRRPTPLRWLKRLKKRRLDPYNEPPALQIRRDNLQVGRNDPCPCGSGKKYKKCCGGSQARTR